MPNQADIPPGESTEKSGWQPIETAPKNSAILVWWPNREYYGSCAYAAMHVDMGTGERWMSYGVEIGRDVHEVPSHWMPLPEPPSNGDRSNEPKSEDSA